MPLPPTPRDRKDFSVAIICALEVESDAVELLFDHIWDANGDRYGKAAHDPYSYRTGVIGNHNVVLAYMTGMGKVQAASVAKSCRWSFPGVRLALIVGVCGGVPGGIEGGVFLGDIVISDEILPYDFGKKYPGTFQCREVTSRSNGDNEVQAFLRKLRSPKGREHLLSRTAHHLDVLRAGAGEYSCPPRQSDQLFEPNYHHKHHGTSKCKTCNEGKACKRAQKATCKALRCDQERLVVRLRSSQREFNIHFGRIASGDTVMKSGRDRDRIADKEKVIAFEMEGAGIDGIMPFLVIKGVCDYADSHKNKIWQKYSAGAAASCMKSLLEQWAVIDQFEKRHYQPRDFSQESHCHIQETASEACALSTRRDEGYHSQYNPDTNNENLLQGDFHVQNLEDLGSLIENFRSVIHQPKKTHTWQEPRIDKIPECRRKFEDFRVIQQAAHSLYDAVGTACAAHTVHKVHIPLQPAIDGTTTRIRFNVALIQHSRAPGDVVWIDVESTIKSHEGYSQLGSTSPSGQNPSLNRRQEVERGNCLSTQRKRVQFRLPTAPIQPLCSEADVVEIPYLHIQRNFCQVVERCLSQQERNRCIGLLGDNGTCKHLAYLASRTSITTTTKSLSELISQTRSDITKEMSQYERVRLAKYLATAVLYYHATPWLNRAWRSEDIHFFNYPDPSIEQPQHIPAYMMSSVSTEYLPASPAYHRFIRNPVLFGLGVMFLELAFQVPLAALELSIDLQERGKSDLAEYSTARRVVEFSHGKISKSFKEVTKRCLYCDFGHDDDFHSPALQQAFYNNVITVLDDLEKRFRELQLD
ncbi:unnamed protein product [Aspergillus oryzae]|uniref:Unnamed protein product n=2 Tax=Aspergillus oryzae TaxID=5062 RepID=A0AAN4YWK0_ASPOZ|nr:unnamed protein product [Aspergillus oryzae]GMF97417.1 unnamed protein product [Aspergillus oryzae]GMG39047.1 unnamed protein product [Aspergillus oryzae]GMG55458.1 unnamed protein product [Aspergillus oryzae var. brunneus]